MKVLLDANFLMLPLQFGIDIYTEIPLIVPEFDFMFTLSLVLEELRIKTQREPLSNQAQKEIKTALDLFMKNSNEIVELNRLPTISVDDCILKYTINKNKNNNKVVVATNDKGLKTKLIKNNLHVVFMRSQKKLVYI